MPRRALVVVLAARLTLAAAHAGADGRVGFDDMTESAGLAGLQHGYRDSLVAADGSFDEARHFAGGIAAGDYDGDGWIDLYLVRGDIGANLLLRNLGDGRFTDVAAEAGVAIADAFGAGPLFADLDGDGWLDLFVGGVRGTRPRLFRNRGDATFEDVTARSGLEVSRDTFSAAAADYDGDGDLDLALAHWNSLIVRSESTETLWRNLGGLRFTDVSDAAGVSAALAGDTAVSWDYSFTPNFADLDDDGHADLLLAADFGTSRVLRNRGDGTFADITDRSVIDDENGMGAAVADFDNDGRLDWFVSSIWDPLGPTIEPWGVSGNRLYRGLGDGRFRDVTDQAGVRDGFWGWAASFADFDNDGWLDLVHTNGFGRSADYVPSQQFFDDPTRLFLANGDGTFSQRAGEWGIDDRGMGRGLAVFDYDRDGALDIAISANGGPLRLFRNRGIGERHWLQVGLRDRGNNREAIGARVTVSAGRHTWMRELRAGNNYLSQDPAEAHFGLGDADLVDELRIRWPDGTIDRHHRLAVDRRLVLERLPPPCPGDCDGDGQVTIDELLRAIRIVLGTAAATSCRAGDRDGDGTIAVDDLLAAVERALVGCAASPRAADHNR